MANKHPSNKPPQQGWIKGSHGAPNAQSPAVDLPLTPAQVKKVKTSHSVAKRMVLENIQLLVFAALKIGLFGKASGMSTGGGVGGYCPPLTKIVLEISLKSMRERVWGGCDSKSSER